MQIIYSLTFEKQILDVVDFIALKEYPNNCDNH